MNEALKKLYSEAIRQHNDAPLYFEKKQDAQNILKAYNPICGDKFELYTDVDSDRIQALHFHGIGCAISKASTSVLVTTLQNKSRKEALALCDLFLELLQRDKPKSMIPQDFNAFSGVRDFPERYDCATLSWREMKSFLESLPN